MPTDTGAAGDTPPASATPAAGSVNANDEQVATDWFDRQMQGLMESLKGLTDWAAAHQQEGHTHGATAAESSGAPSAEQTRAPAENAPGGQPAAAAPRPERAPRPGHRWFRRLGG